MKAKRLPPGAGEDDDLDDDSEEEDDRDEAKKTTTKTSKISKNLSDLVNLISAVHFHGFDQGERDFSAHGSFLGQRFESGSDRVRNFLADFKGRMRIRYSGSTSVMFFFLGVIIFTVN